VVTSSADSFSAVGTYPVTATGGFDNNYFFQFFRRYAHSFQSGAFGDGARPDHHTLPALELSYSGCVASDDVDDLETAPSATTDATLDANAGSYSIDAAVGSDQSYDFDYVPGALTIDQSVAQVIIEDLEQESDGSSKSPSFTTVPAGLTLVITYHGSSDAPIVEGTYEVMANVDEQNYQGSAMATFFLSSPEEILSVDEDVIIALFPNPASDYLTIFGKTGQIAENLDIRGQSVARTALRERQAEIEVRHLRRGLYQVRLIDGQEVVAREKIFFM